MSRRWPRGLRPVWLVLSACGLLVACVALRSDVHAQEPVIEVGTRAVVLGPSTIVIDIKPGSYPNSINLWCQGNIPVAVLTTPDINASTVDPRTATFAGARPIHWALTDVDRDRDRDLLLHFRCRDVRIPLGATQACLQARTFESYEVEGCDSVRIVHFRWPLTGSSLFSFIFPVKHLPPLTASFLPTAELLPAPSPQPPSVFSLGVPPTPTFPPPSAPATLPSFANGSSTWDRSLPWAGATFGGSLTLISVALVLRQRPRR